MEKMTVNGKEYEVVKLLGKGKGGYSYLVTDGDEQYVLKQLHHEPCAYYENKDKVQEELKDYRRLTRIGIMMPGMVEIDREQERILKEYIDGDTAYDMILKDELKPEHLQQVKRMSAMVTLEDTNIDYFPTNFVVENGFVYYVDFECDDYTEDLNFENWGRKYWSKTPEFMAYVSEHEKLQA